MKNKLLGAPQAMNEITVTVSGVAGSGKTTIINLINQALRNENGLHTVVEMCEPQDDPLDRIVQRVRSLRDRDVMVTIVEQPAAWSHEQHARDTASPMLKRTLKFNVAPTVQYSKTEVVNYGPLLDMYAVRAREIAYDRAMEVI